MLISLIATVGSTAVCLNEMSESNSKPRRKPERKFNSETNIDLSKSKYYGKDIVQSESNELHS